MGGDPRQPAAPEAQLAVWVVLDDPYGELLVAARAPEAPEAVAVTCGADRLTYRELDERANRLAHPLLSLGAGPDVLVGLSVERGTDMVAGMLGILKSGAAYVPLDPAYTADRLERMVRDSGAKILVTQDALRERLPVSETVVVDLGETFGGPFPTTAPVGVAPSRSDLGYVIYTSGSTGLPKGVAVEHGSVLDLFANACPLFGFDALDVWTVFHSYAFDSSVWELGACLTSGGRAVVVPREVARNSEAMWRLLTDEGVTVLNQTPSMFGELGATAAAEGAAAPSRLRWLVFGGEALEPKHLLT
ncbi:AMP-binding protein [Streptomyces sp. NPDC006678]|uniref:AMP-binding protein n=1 Tax=Streptomyces sp. NPDC006678 TaxID=3157185 RepID=UPI0033D78CCD